MSENIQYKEQSWKGLSWETIADTARLRIQVEKNSSNHPNVSKFIDILDEVINTIQYNTIHDETSSGVRKVQVALFPQNLYRLSLDLGAKIPDWVQVCRRDEKTCYDLSIADNWGTTLKSLPADHRREIVHELAHELFLCFSSDSGWTSLAIREGVVESIPRVVLGIQSELRESTQFIGNHLTNNLINPLEIDENGLFHFSKEPLSINPAYLSATTYVIGLSARLGNGDVQAGLTLIKKMADLHKNRELFEKSIAAKIGLSEYHKLPFKDLQIQGAEILTTF